MLIDDVTIHVRAGKGGDGVVRFARTMMSQGPTGGNGGRGGDVVVVGVADLGALRVFRSVKTVTASNGSNGEQNIKTGGDGDDAVIDVPVGTVVHDYATGAVHDIVKRGQRVVIAEGGRGGMGNFHFRSSRVTSPKRATSGRTGDQKDIQLELKMIADIGLVGYPNVGKSSLLNALTHASSKVGNYRFTTLEPNLGVYYDAIIADLPGLIEGAATGKGLGHKFLRHVERTRVLFHLVAADSDDPVADYMAIRTELEQYNPALTQKPEWVFVSRADEVSPERVETIIHLLSEKNPRVQRLSLLDEGSLVQCQQRIAALMRESAVAHELPGDAAQEMPT